MLGFMAIEQHEVSGTCGTFSRKVWFWMSESAGETHFTGEISNRSATSGKPATPRQLCIFLDGEYYVERMRSWETFQAMHDRGELPALACVFVSHVNGAERHADFTCNRAYADFIVRDLLPWLADKSGGRPKTGAESQGAQPQCLLAGISLSGLQAAYTALLYPSLFPMALCHSGSFWWKDEWLTAQVPGFGGDVGNRRFYMSVGDKETQEGVSHPPTGLRQDVTQVAGCTRFADSLRARGVTVRFHLYAGGHELAPWQAELPEAMSWLLDDRGAAIAATAAIDTTPRDMARTESS